MFLRKPLEIHTNLFFHFIKRDTRNVCYVLYFLKLSQYSCKTYTRTKSERMLKTVELKYYWQKYFRDYIICIHTWEICRQVCFSLFFLSWETLIKFLRFALYSNKQHYSSDIIGDYNKLTSHLVSLSNVFLLPSDGCLRALLQATSGICVWNCKRIIPMLHGKNCVRFFKLFDASKNRTAMCWFPSWHHSDNF